MVTLDEEIIENTLPADIVAELPHLARLGREPRRVLNNNRVRAHDGDCDTQENLITGAICVASLLGVATGQTLGLVLAGVCYYRIDECNH